MRTTEIEKENQDSLRYDEEIIKEMIAPDSCNLASTGEQTLVSRPVRANLAA
jgi:hypothetical protein